MEFIPAKEQEKKAFELMKADFGYKNMLAAPRFEKIVISSMKNALPLNIPVEVSCGWGNNWLEAH